MCVERKNDKLVNCQTCGGVPAIITVDHELKKEVEIYVETRREYEKINKEVVLRISCSKCDEEYYQYEGQDELYHWNRDQIGTYERNRLTLVNSFIASGSNPKVAIDQATRTLYLLYGGIDR